MIGSNDSSRVYRSMKGVERPTFYEIKEPGKGSRWGVVYKKKRTEEMNPIESKTELVSQTINESSKNNETPNIAHELIYATVAREKMQLKLWKEADEVFNQIFLNFGENVSPDVLFEAACVKFSLNKWDEADALNDRAISILGDNAPIELIFVAAALKFELGQLENADKLFNRGFTLLGDSTEILGDDSDINFIIKAVAVKLELNCSRNEDQSFNKAILLLKKMASPDFIKNLAEFQVQLGRIERASRLYDMAITFLDENRPFVLAAAALLKMELGQLESADALFNRAFDGTTDPMPMLTYMAAAVLRFKLSHLQESEEEKKHLCGESNRICDYVYNVCTPIDAYNLITIAYLKTQLGNSEWVKERKDAVDLALQTTPIHPFKDELRMVMYGE